MDVLARDFAQDGGGIKDRVLRHRAGRLVETHRALALFMRGERDGLDLDDGAKEARDAEAEDMALLRRLLRLFRDELIEAADLRDLVDVLLLHGELDGGERLRRGLLPILAGLLRRAQRLADAHVLAAALERERVGVREDVDGLAALDGVLRDEIGDAVRELHVELLRRVADDFHDVGGRERLEVDLRAARAQRGIDVPRVARRRADEHEVRGRALLEELPDVGRHLRVGRVVVRRVEIGALVLEDLEELVLQHLVHLTDLVDEEDAAVRVRHEAGLRLGNAVVGERLLRALIDGVVHGA